MSAEATMMKAMRSSTVATNVSYTRNFRWPQKKKFKGLRSGERGGKAIGLPRPIHLSGYVERGGYTPQSKNVLLHHRA
ncbi:hypothetical protein TNCV_2999051 [Trichonephila clavipes]|nr:hypothetical protein TNCV_2999051 [Trichonephila clavipes]